MNGFEDWSEEDVIRHNQRIKKQMANIMPLQKRPVRNQPRAKYGNVKTEIGGTKYDSKKEAQRGEELKLLERQGKIHNLELQKKYVLQPSFKFLGKTIREIAYIADFVYKDENENVVVEDVKSDITRKNPIYKLKKKMMMYVHKIDIREV